MKFHIHFGEFTFFDNSAHLDHILNGFYFGNPNPQRFELSWTNSARLRIFANPQESADLQENTHFDPEQVFPYRWDGYFDLYASQAPPLLDFGAPPEIDFFRCFRWFEAKNDFFSAETKKPRIFFYIRVL